jgi:hypothetical protein
MSSSDLTPTEQLVDQWNASPLENPYRNTSISWNRSSSDGIPTTTSIGSITTPARLASSVPALPILPNKPLSIRYIPLNSSNIEKDSSPSSNNAPSASPSPPLIPVSPVHVQRIRQTLTVDSDTSGNIGVGSGSGGSAGRGIYFAPMSTRSLNPSLHQRSISPFQSRSFTPQSLSISEVGTSSSSSHGMNHFSFGSNSSTPHPESSPSARSATRNSFYNSPSNTQQMQQQSQQQQQQPQQSSSHQTLIRRLGTMEEKYAILQGSYQDSEVFRLNLQSQNDVMRHALHRMGVDPDSILTPSSSSSSSSSSHTTKVPSPHPPMHPIPSPLLSSVNDSSSSSPSIHHVRGRSGVQRSPKNTSSALTFNFPTSPHHQQQQQHQQFFQSPSPPCRNSSPSPVRKEGSHTSAAAAALVAAAAASSSPQQLEQHMAFGSEVLLGFTGTIIPSQHSPSPTSSPFFSHVNGTTSAQFSPIPRSSPSSSSSSGSFSSSTVAATVFRNARRQLSIGNGVGIEGGGTEIGLGITLPGSTNFDHSSPISTPITLTPIPTTLIASSVGGTHMEILNSSPTQESNQISPERTNILPSLNLSTLRRGRVSPSPYQQQLHHQRQHQQPPQQSSLHFAGTSSPHHSRASSRVFPVCSTPSPHLDGIIHISHPSLSSSTEGELLSTTNRLCKSLARRETSMTPMEWNQVMGLMANGNSAVGNTTNSGSAESSPKKELGV